MVKLQQIMMEIGTNQWVVLPIGQLYNLGVECQEVELVRSKDLSLHLHKMQR